jgi:hypothetical protein
MGSIDQGAAKKPQERAGSAGVKLGRREITHQRASYAAAGWSGSDPKRLILQARTKPIAITSGRSFDIISTRSANSCMR